MGGGGGVNPFTNYALILHAFTVHQFSLNSFIPFLSKSSSFAFYVPSLLDCFGRNSSLLSSWPLEVLPILTCGPVGLETRPPQICYINVEFGGHRVPVIISVFKVDLLIFTKTFHNFKKSLSRMYFRISQKAKKRIYKSYI